MEWNAQSKHSLLVVNFRFSIPCGRRIVAMKHFQFEYTISIAEKLR